MRYEEFLERYKAAYGDWQAGIGDAQAGLASLRELVPQIEDEDRRGTARFLLREWESEVSPAAQARMTRASRALSGAENAQGSAADRIGRLEAAIEVITAIAGEADDESEQVAILALNEPLAMLVDSLRQEADA